MEFLFELLFQTLGEMLLQLITQILVELGMHSLLDTTKAPRHPALSTIGFLFWGALLGGLSLIVMSQSPIQNVGLRKLNLLVTPTISGLVMMGIGALRRSKGQVHLKIDQFGYGFVFALSFSLVRYCFVQNTT